MSSNGSQRNKKLVDDDECNYETNFDAGQVNVQERYLHKTGIRGTKICIFVTVLIILLLLCIINLVILAIMYGVLQIDKDGMESLSFFENGMVRWTKPSDLDTITVYQNHIGAFNDRDLQIETIDKEIILHGGPMLDSSQVHIGDGNTTISARKGFSFVDPFAEKEIIRFDGSSSQFLQESVTGHDIGINTVLTHRIVSNEHQNLTLEADGSKVEIVGNEGIDMDGKSIVLDAQDDISIMAGNKIVFDAQNLIFKGLVSSNAGKYKLCSCIGSYKLFLVNQTTPSSSCNTLENVCP